MQRLNDILSKSKKAKEQAGETVKSSSAAVGETRMGMRVRDFSRSIKDAHVPKYILMAICLYKTITVYDKMKQIVAVQNL